MMMSNFSSQPQKQNNNNNYQIIKKKIEYSNDKNNNKRRNKEQKKNHQEIFTNSSSSTRIDFDKLFETCNLTDSVMINASSPFAPPPISLIDAVKLKENEEIKNQLFSLTQQQDQQQQYNFSYNSSTKEKEEEEEENKKIDEQTKMLYDKLAKLSLNEKMINNTTNDGVVTTTPLKDEKENKLSSSLLVKNEEESNNIKLLPSPSKKNIIDGDGENSKTSKTTDLPESKKNTNNTGKVVIVSSRVTKIKAIVKPYGDYVKLEPEIVMINSKCTFGRIQKVITSKLIEISKEQKEKQSKAGWYERCISSSSLKGITSSDSVFLRVNGVLSPSYSQTISDFVNSKKKTNDDKGDILIEYFLQPTFG